MRNADADHHKLCMNKEFFIKQLSEIITEYENIRARAQYTDLSGNVHLDEVPATISKAKAAIARITSTDSEYYKDVAQALEEKRITNGDKLHIIIGSVRALQSDLKNDYLKSFHDIVQSEVFSDYLEMADYLLKEGYKDPAAVIIGSTLEAHLRELCKSSAIETEALNTKGKLVPKKADLLNSELAKGKIYSSAYQKQITAWLDIRNSAAHGNYEEYSTEEIRLMSQGVKNFVAPIS